MNFKRTATCCETNAWKKLPHEGNSVTTNEAPATPEFFKSIPNSAKGAADAAAASGVSNGLIKITVCDVENPPQPSSAQVNPLSVKIDHISCVSVVLGSENATITVCSLTTGEASTVASTTTPNVPPPPFHTSCQSQVYLIELVQPPRNAKNKS